MECRMFMCCVGYRQVSPNDFGSVESVMKKIIKEKQPFERLEMKKEDLLKMFEVCSYPVISKLLLTVLLHS